MENNKKNEQVQDSEKPKIQTSVVTKGRKSIATLQKMKDNGTPIVQYCPTSLDQYWTVSAEMAGVDVVRYPTPGETVDMKIANMPWWTRHLRKAASYIHLNCVMETPMYSDKYTALKNASMLMYEGADSVLPMGVNLETLKYLSDNHVVVFGHVGILSGWQTSKYGGYKKMGTTADEAMEIFRNAYEYQENGMMAMTIELVPREVTNAIAKKLRVPVINIAAGGAADGSELVHFDMFGMMPKDKMGVHAKVYGEYFQFTNNAFGAFVNDVRTGAYPAKEHGWGMDERELDKFLNTLEQKY